MMIVSSRVETRYGSVSFGSVLVLGPRNVAQKPFVMSCRRMVFYSFCAAPDIRVGWCWLFDGWVRMSPRQRLF